MALRYEELSELNNVLLDAFPSQRDLELLMFEIGISLEEFPRHNTLRSTIYEVIQWANLHDHIDELIEAAWNRNPGNAALQSFLKRYRHLEHLTSANPAEDWIDYGLLKQAEGAYEDAIFAYVTATEIAEENDDFQNKARALQLSGSFYRNLGNTELAVLNLEASLLAARSSKNIDLVLSVLQELSSIYSQIGNTAKAISYTKELYTFNHQTNKRLDAAKNLNDIAHLYSLLGQFKRAQSLLQQAIALWRELGDVTGQILSIIELGTTFLHLEDLESAKHNFKSALELAVKAKSRASEALSLSSLGSLAFQNTNYLEAQNFFHKALEIYEKLNDTNGLTSSLANLGRVNEAQHEWDKALLYYRRSLSLAQRIQDRAGEATALTNIGKVLFEEGRLADANTSLSQALNILQSLGDSVGIARTQDLLRLISRQKSQVQQPIEILIEDARRFFQRAGFILDSSKDLNGFICNPTNSYWEGRITSPVYTIISVNKSLNGKRILQIRNEAQESKLEPLNAFVIVDKPVEDSGWLQIAALRADDFQVMPIPITLLYEGETLGKSYWEQMALSKHLTRFLGDGDDPFDVRDPVFDVLNFFGREALANHFMERLKQGKPFGIFGLRKMGKSSLMRYLQGKIPYPAAWIDLQAGVKLESIYKRILRCWQNDSKTRFDLELSLNENEVNINDPSSDFLTQTKKALDYLADNQKEPRLVIFLDEIELIIPPAGSAEEAFEQYLSLLRTLRGLVQEDRRVSLMVAGVDPSINRISRLGDKKVQNPFYKLLQEEYIPPLLPADCIQMVRNIGRQVEISFSDNAANYIAEESGGHPSLARQLCSLVYRDCGRQPGEISYGQVQEAVNDFIFDPEYNSFLNENGLWGETTNQNLWGIEAADINQKILLNLAEKSRHIHRSMLLKDLNPALARSCLSTLTRLWIIREIVAKEENYTISFGIFRSWIRQNILGLEQ